MATQALIMIILAFALVFLGAVIAAGKGDWLIAGYNTASKEEKANFNIKRLRVCIATIAFVTGGATLLSACSTWDYTGIMYTTFSIVVVATGLYCANTWAKKK